MRSIESAPEQQLILGFSAHRMFQRRVLFRMGSRDRIGDLCRVSVAPTRAETTNECVAYVPA